MGVEDLLAIDAATGGAVRAPHVVGLDLEARDRVGPRLMRQHECVIALVAVSFMGGFVDLDHAAPDQP